MAIPHAPTPAAARGPSRRLLLGLVAAVPALAAVATTAAAAEEEVELECLADLIETGEVTRADLVAG